MIPRQNPPTSPCPIFSAGAEPKSFSCLANEVHVYVTNSSATIEFQDGLHAHVSLPHSSTGTACYKPLPQVTD